jgi:GxxExxY protein
LGFGENKMLHEQLTKEIIGVFFEVYNELGYGFTEKIYEKALRIALGQAGHKVLAQVKLEVGFRNEVLGEYMIDLLVDDLIVLEIKAVLEIVPAHEHQVMTYLKASGFEVGLVFNFGPKPEFKRVFLENKKKGMAGKMEQEKQL